VPAHAAGLVTRSGGQSLSLAAFAQGDCGRVMVVLLTDGRANVSLAKSNRDPDALAEDAPKPSTVWSMLPATRTVQHAVLLCLASDCPTRYWHLTAQAMAPGHWQTVPTCWDVNLSAGSSTFAQLHVLCCAAGAAEGGGHEHGKADRRGQFQLAGN
jgi:hypothetical protein